MKKKRIISIILSLITMFSAFSAYAISDSEALDRGISYGWAEYDHDESITRAEFAEMMLRFAVIPATGGSTSSFEDIPNGDESLSYINTAVDQKIILPYLNNRFDPEGVVTKQQVARAVLTVLGYGGWAESAGGYPNGYIKTAAGTAMFDGIKKGETDVMTYSDVIRVLANSSTIPLCEPVYQNGYIDYDVNEDKTILSENHEASSIKGTIIANDITSITGLYATKGCIIVNTNIGHVQLNSGGKDVTKYIGYNATVYYKTENDQDILAYIVPNSKTKEITFNNSDVDKYSNGTYQYYEDGKRKTARIANDAEVIYNGKRVTDLSAFKDASYMYFPRNEKEIPDDGTIKLVSTDGSSNYNLVFVNVMDCFVVDHYGGTNKSIYFKDNKAAVNVEDEDDYDIYDLDGKEMLPTELKEWDVLEAYKAADNSYTKYVVVRNVVEGTVTSIKKSNNDYDEIVINGNSYYYDNEDDGKIAVGIGGVFLLSSNNRIIMMTDESVAHDVTFGYLVSSWHEDYEDMGEARILTMDGNLVIYKFANKVKLDGVTYKKQDDMPLENRQLITYKLANNELKTIDTVYSNKTASPSDLRVLYSNMPNGSASESEKSDGLLYKKNLNCFGGRILVNADTKFVTVPDKNSRFEKYSVNSISSLKNDKNYKNLTAYALGKNSITADIIVQELAGGIDGDIEGETNIAVVSDVMYGLNPKEDEADAMEVYINGTTQNIFGEGRNTLGKTEGDSFYPVSVGDIVRYNIDSDGIVTTLDPIYIQSYGELAMPDDFEKNIYGTDRRFLCWAYDRAGDFLGVAVNPNHEIVSPERGSVVYFSASQANVYIYDRSRKKVYTGTLDDVETYSTVSDECSNIYVSAFKGEIKDIVVFLD